jgi:hypothetical protein
MNRFKRSKNTITSQSNSILNYIKIKKEINNNGLNDGQQFLQSSLPVSIPLVLTKKHELYEFETKKWQTDLKFNTIRDLNKEIKLFVIQRFGKLDYETKSIKELQKKDILFMTKLREAFEIRGINTVKRDQIWSRVQNSNRTRRYNLKKRFRN